MKSRNNAAFDILYNRYFDKLVYFSYNIVYNQATAEDIVQDSFIAALNSIQSFNFKNKFSTWLYTIVRNNSINHLNSHNRKRDKINSEIFPINFENIYIDYDSNIILKSLNNLLSQLSDKDRQVYQLRIQQDQSIKDIAKIVKIPEGSVKSSLYYTFKKISNQLKTLINE